jgi:hypothetical protein
MSHPSVFYYQFALLHEDLAYIVIDIAMESSRCLHTLFRVPRSTPGVLAHNRTCLQRNARSAQTPMYSLTLRAYESTNGPPTRSRKLRYLPMILQPEMLKMFVPPVWKKTYQAYKERDKAKKNPATKYVWLTVFASSGLIHLYNVRRDIDIFNSFSNRKIEQLRDVVEAIQRGEEVDVEGILGTGLPEQELEWAEGTVSFFYVGCGE